MTKKVGSLIYDFQPHRLSNVSCSNTRGLWKGVNNVNHVADDRNSISSNIGDADVIITTSPMLVLMPVMTGKQWLISYEPSAIPVTPKTTSFLTTKCTGV